MLHTRLTGATLLLSLLFTTPSQASNSFKIGPPQTEEDGMCASLALRVVAAPRCPGAGAKVPWLASKCHRSLTEGDIADAKADLSREEKARGLEGACTWTLEAN
jgi:hypothetical protein